MHRGWWIFVIVALLTPALPARAQLTVVPVAAKQLLYDPQTRLIYASVGPNGGEFANSLVAIDPTGGKIVKSVPTATEPGEFALSQKSRFLYVAVGGAKQIRRFDLPGLTPSLTFALAEGSVIKGLLPGDTPESVMVVKEGNGPPGIIVYDNEKARRFGHSPLMKVVRGLPPQTYYATFSIDLMGLFLTERGSAMRFTAFGLPGGGLQSSANGLIYYGDGSVVDPETQQQVGKFPEFSGIACADPETGSAYTVEGEKDDFKVTVYDGIAYRKIGSIPLSRVGASGGAADLIVCGNDTLAFRAGDRVVLMKGVRRPQIVAVDLEVTRSALPKRLPRDGRWSYTLTVTNRGKAKASGVYLTDRLDGDNILGGAKASQGTAILAPKLIRAELGALEPGASATVTVDLATADLAEFGATAIARTAEPDLNPVNNMEHLETDIGPLPDLTANMEDIQQVSQGSGINLETLLGASVVVQNVGEGDAPTCIARFYFSDSPRLIVEEAQLIQDVQVPAIKAGKSSRIQLRAPLGNGGDLTGSYLHVILDPINRVREEAKTNNVSSGKIR